MAMKTCHILQFLLRLTFVLSVWLLIIPFITFWIWRFSFVRNYTEAQSLFVSHLSTTFILTDCLHGFLLSASIVFIFLGATSLRDYFRHLQEVEGADGDREDVARRQNGEANRNGGDGEGHGMIRRNAENVAARWELQAARLEAHVEQMFDGLDDENGGEDVPFDELVGMQGPIFHLVENAFTVLASNMIFLGVIILVPFHLGRFIIHHLSWFLSPVNTSILSTMHHPLNHQSLTLANITLKNTLTNLTQAINQNSTSSNSSDIIKSTAITSRLSDVTTLAVGYIFLFSIIIIYLGGILVIRYMKGEPLTSGRFYGIASIAETVPSLFRQFMAAMRHLLTMVKVAFLLVIELGVFPLMCGWWLDFCTIKMFGKSMSQRVDFFSVSPLASSLIHWVVGIVYMLQVSIFVSLLRGVLRNGVLYFLRDPADPNYNPFRDLIDDPVHKHARRVLLSVTVYGSLIVMLVFLPVKLAMKMAPSVFPLDISVSDPFTEIPANMLLFQICIPFAIEHFKLRATIKSLLKQWFTIAGSALGLTNFLLPTPEDETGQGNTNGQLPGQYQAIVGYLPPQDPNQSLQQEPNHNQESDPERYGFVLSIVLLLVMAWMTLLIFNSAIIVVPVSIGRAIFNSIPLLPVTHGIKCNDLYAFIIGSYIIWTLLAGVRYSLEQIKTRRAIILLHQISKWCSIVAKSSILLSIWIFIIPVLIGLLFELLIIVLMRVPVDETPVFLLYQDWALGLLFLKIWTRLVTLNHHVLPLFSATWRVKFDRVHADGFSRLQLLWILREIVLPIVSKLLTALCVPYVLARGVFPSFGYPLVVNSVVYRFAWVGCLGFSLVCYSGKRFHVWFSELHNSIRDDRYLIGRRLHNFGEDKNLGLLMRENVGGDDGELTLRHRRNIVIED